MLVLIAAILGGLVLGVLVAILGISIWVAHTHTRVTRRPVHGHPSLLGLDFEEVSFPSRIDRVLLKGWYLPAQPDDRCIVFLQGEEDHRNSPGIRALELGRDLVQKGFSVLLYDFRGRGESGGSRSSAGDREQWGLLGALDFVQGRSIPLERTGLLGFSLGAAVAILVAAREKRIPALVADSAFMDYTSALKEVTFYRFTLPGWFVFPIALAGSLLFGANFRKVRPVKVIHQVAPRPILFIHGEKDDVIPPREAEDLHRAAGNRNNPLWIVPGADHAHSYATRPDEYARRVGVFFEEHIPQRLKSLP